MQKCRFGDPRLPERFWAKIEVFHPTGCWEWVARISAKGYGQVMYEGRVWQAHRLAFTVLDRPIPVELVIDHRCENRACVNPNHFDVVTVEHNNFVGWGASAMQIRFPHCKQGHPFDGQDRGGKRFCSQCRRDRAKHYQRKRRQSPEYVARERERGREYDRKRREKVAA